MQKTPLEEWISHRIHGLSGRELTRESIRGFQLARLKATLDYVLEKSQFYREQLRGISSKDVRDLNDLSALPTTTASDLQTKGHQFLCVSQGEVERVVTLPFPEGTDAPRRTYFSGNDLELTIDFFHHGMTTFVRPGQKVLILMPGERAGSVGDLLVKALSRAGIRGFVHGVVRDPATTIREIVDQAVDCLVGIPTQVLALARHEYAEEIPQGLIKSVLLSADYVPSPVVRELQRIWRCKVFGHYGTTEMGFGGGVECEAFAGYHMREADLLFEIVDPATGRPLPDGKSGEIVFTTLSRTAMPLVRYRTGDLSRFLPDPCPCGTVLTRLEKVRGKVNEMVRLRSGDWLSITDLDEALFVLPGIVNYSACLTRSLDADRLEVAIYSGSRDNLPDQGEILRALTGVPEIAAATEARHLIVEPIRFSAENWITTGAAKRVILQRREKE